MFVKEISYVDFNGVDRKDKFYFHLSLPEVTRIEASLEGTVKDHIEKLIKDDNMKVLLDFLELVILTSYGEKTKDGRSFRKSNEIREEFSNSPAYAEFFEELFTTPGLAQEFGSKVAQGGKGRRRKDQPNLELLVEQATSDSVEDTIPEE